MTAATRISRWLAEYQKSRQHDQEYIHAFHVGHEREAALTPADLAALLERERELIRLLVAAGEYVAEAVEAHRHDDGAALLAAISAATALAACPPQNRKPA